MWAQDQNRDNLKIVLIIAEIFVIAAIVIALAWFLWEKANISNLDFSLQIVFVGLFSLLIVFVSNYIVNRRW